MRENSGQIALVVLLIMVALLTIGLAVVSRSVTDIRISKETEESARAFSAAEAGIEEILKREVLTAGSEEVPVGDLTAQVTVNISNTFKSKIERNETAEVNLKKDSEGWAGNLEITWSGKVLELTLIYIPVGGSKYSILREVRNLTSDDCGAIADFTESYTFAVPESESGADIEKVLRVRPICAEATVTVAPAAGEEDLPDQSYKIRSSAAIEETGQTRVVEVIKSLPPILPPTFDYVLYSGGAI